MQKRASAEWKGSLKDGTGVISTESGTLNQQHFGFNSRFEGKLGTNPEELIGAAHAACFAMALSAELGKLGITANAINTLACVYLEKDASGFTITRSDIQLKLDAGDTDKSVINKAIENTKVNCPVSKLLNAKILVTVDDVTNGVKRRPADIYRIPKKAPFIEDLSKKRPSEGTNNVVSHLFE
jgi:osmotically inducible protein OsmC